MAEFTFFSIGDFGNDTPELRQVAAAMNQLASTNAPDFILGLGDNFYPSGVQSVTDPRFESWANIFLSQEFLRVPWKVILGNHDYLGNPEAQIAYTSHERNQGGFWSMPNYHYTFKHIARSANESVSVDMFGIDSNACQGHVQRRHRKIWSDMTDQKAWLRDVLDKSTESDWKIVFGHHPMYTKGYGHGEVGRCLRDQQYSRVVYNRIEREQRVETSKGIGLEDILVNSGVHLYISGHEHVFQHHNSRGVQHVVCGNSGAEVRDHGGFYQGPDPTVTVDWVDETNTYGFTTYHVTKDRIIIKFIDSRGALLEEVVVRNDKRRLIVPPHAPDAPIITTAAVGEEVVGEEETKAAVSQEREGIEASASKNVR
jgi:tartrate-resistant acid phosphatase type 5